MGKDPKEISIHKGEIIEEMKGEMKGGVLIEVTIYDNTPILVVKSFTNFNFADFILVNQRITIP